MARARREATRQEYGRAVAKRWEKEHEGTMWAWKSGTFRQLAEDFGRRTEDGWRHDATQMSDTEIFETLGMDEELVEETEQTTEDTTEATEIEATETETEMATEEEAKAETTIAQKDPSHTVASRMAELVAGGCDRDEIAERLAQTYEEWGCDEDEAHKLANEHLAEELGENRTQAQKWEQDPDTADAWQKVWEHVRAGRIGGYTQEWAFTDDAWLLAAEFATEILGEMDEPTAEWEDLVDKCLAEIGRLL